MAKNKTTKKTTEKEVPVGALIPQPHGGAIRNGGTNKGGSGRPPDEFKRKMQELASSDEMLRHVRTVLNDPNHPQWLGAWKWATERGYGKEVQPIDLKVETEVVLDLRVKRGDSDPHD